MAWKPAITKVGSWGMGFSWDFPWDFHGIQWWPNRIINHGCEICHGGVQFLAGKIIELNGVVSSHVTPGCFLRNVDDQIVGFLCQSDTRSLIYHDLSFVYGIYVYRRYLSTSRFIWNEEGFWWCLSEGTMDLVGTRFANIGGQIYRPHDANLMIESRFSGWSFSLKARELLDGFRCWSSQFCFRIRIRWCLGRQSEDVWTNPLDPSLVDHVAKYQRFWRENGLKTVKCLVLNQLTHPTVNLPRQI